MEKLDKVIAGLECCGRPNPTNCFDCPYRDDDVCHDTMYHDVLELLKEYRKCLRFCGIRQYGMEGLNGND